ncbi:hypothetical protein ES705_38537 [subsurface metagenome]
MRSSDWVRKKFQIGGKNLIFNVYESKSQKVLQLSPNESVIITPISNPVNYIEIIGVFVIIVKSNSIPNDVKGNCLKISMLLSECLTTQKLVAGRDIL